MWVESAHTPAFVKGELGGGVAVFLPQRAQTDAGNLLTAKRLHLPLGAGVSLLPGVYLSLFKI